MDTQEATINNVLSISFPICTFLPFPCAVSAILLSLNVMLNGLSSVRCNCQLLANSFLNSLHFVVMFEKLKQVSSCIKTDSNTIFLLHSKLIKVFMLVGAKE
uniref:Uncharacterized protein n=1 Tax=Glossina palpalis gambiensis TaxID=67801 RepID=A0A1B0ANT4_9MUSC